MACAVTCAALGAGCIAYMDMQHGVHDAAADCKGSAHMFQSFIASAMQVVRARQSKDCHAHGHLTKGRPVCEAAANKVVMPQIRAQQDSADL